MCDVAWLLGQAGMQSVTGKMCCLVVRSKEWEWLASFIIGSSTLDVDCNFIDVYFYVFASYNSSPNFHTVCFRYDITYIVRVSLNTNTPWDFCAHFCPFIYWFTDSSFIHSFIHSFILSLFIKPLGNTTNAVKHKVKINMSTKYKSSKNVKSTCYNWTELIVKSQIVYCIENWHYILHIFKLFMWNILRKWQQVGEND